MADQTVDDPVLQFLQEGSKGAPATQTSTDPVLDFLSSGGENIPPEVRQAIPAKKEGAVSQFLKGAASLVDTAYGVVPAAVGGVTYAAERALGKTPEQATKSSEGVTSAIENPVGQAFGITNDPAYQNEASRKVMDFIGQNISKGAGWISAHTGLPVSDVENMANTLSFAAPAMVGNLVTSKPVKATTSEIRTAASDLTDRFRQIKETPKPTQYGSVGSAGAVTSDVAAAANATPEVISAIRNAETTNGINHQAAARHIEASSLPVPVELTAGQATGDVNLLSKEQNSRARFPELAQHFNEQNAKLVQNLDAIRDSVAPDVYTNNHVDMGQNLIDSYKMKDAALKVGIKEAYSDLEKANGGAFPVNGPDFVKSADSALSVKMKGAYVPPEIRADMDAIAKGGNMTFEQFENMRTNLAAEERLAERTGNGNRAYAVSIVRNALENLPMEGETAQLKAIADKARSMAKERFSLLDSDPAYKASVNDTVAPDDFIRKYVINGKVGDVGTMQANLAHDPLASQTISAATLNHLKSQAGISPQGVGNFTQAGYNKALTQIDPKLKLLLPPEHQDLVRTLGNVARYTQEQPRGAYVNTSNTFTAAAGEAAKSTAKNVAETALNVAIPKLGLGSWLRKGIESKAEQAVIQKHIQPGAGISLKDFPR